MIESGETDWAATADEALRQNNGTHRGPVRRYAMWAALIYAILDLADAIRGHGRP